MSFHYICYTYYGCYQHDYYDNGDDNDQNWLQIITIFNMITLMIIMFFYQQQLMLQLYIQSHHHI